MTLSKKWQLWLPELYSKKKYDMSIKVCRSSLIHSCTPMFWSAKSTQHSLALLQSQKRNHKQVTPIKDYLEIVLICSHFRLVLRFQPNYFCDYGFKLRWSFKSRTVLNMKQWASALLQLQTLDRRKQLHIFCLYCM